MNALSPLTPDTGAGERLRGHHVMLRADSLRLLLPQREVGAARNLEQQPRPSRERGVFVLGEGEDARPVVALSSAMRPLTEMPLDRFVLVQLSIGQADLWFAWSEVRVLMNLDLERHRVPPVMRNPGAPVDSWVRLDGGIALCSSAELLVEYALARRA